MWGMDALLRELLPAQGQWSEAAYLWLTDHASRLIEFTDGYEELLSGHVLFTNALVAF